MGCVEGVWVRERPDVERRLCGAKVRKVFIAGTHRLKDPARFDVPTDCSAELSPSGYAFFTDLFETFDQVRPCRAIPNIPR